MTAPRLLVLALALALAAPACTPALSGGDASVPTFDPEGQTKCAVKTSQQRPLIVEWPASDRATLEAQMRRGRVVVRYDGCELEVLRHCKAPGSYGYAALNPKRENVTMKSEDDLYANIPIYAAKFEGVLAEHQQLDVDMTIVGMFESEHMGAVRSELSGECSRATHVVDAFTVGSFAFLAGGSSEAGAGIELAGAGVGARRKREKIALREEGKLEACQLASTTDLAPPDGCGGLLRIEVTPIGDGPARASVAEVEAAEPVAVPEKVPDDTPAAAKLAPEDEGFVDRQAGAGWGNRCFAHVKAGRIVEARAACNRGLGMGPSPFIRGAILYSLASAEVLAGDTKAACGHLAASLEARPDDAATRRRQRQLTCQ
jgi:hypothetical protein